MLFFSSRRRHKRWPRDWSSDVCSSDLILDPHLVLDGLEVRVQDAEARAGADLDTDADAEIGRAACREREEIGAVADEYGIKNEGERGGDKTTEKHRSIGDARVSRSEII